MDNGEVVMSDFIDAKRNLILPLSNLPNTPHPLDQVNILAGIGG